MLWRVEYMDGPVHVLNKMDFDVKELGLAAEEITRGLEEAVKRGSILMVQKDAVVYFLLNSPRGRAATQASETGKGNPAEGTSPPRREPPNRVELHQDKIAH